MTDMLANGHIGSRRGFGKRRKYEGYNTDKSPVESDLDSQTPEQADRFPLYTPDQIEMDTATVQLRLTFEEPIQIRDQCEMIAEACRIIIALTRKHDLGSVRQRVECRREARSLSKALVRFNGGYPRGVWKPKSSKP